MKRDLEQQHKTRETRETREAPQNQAQAQSQAQAREASSRLLTWCEIDRAALLGNTRALRRHLPPETLLAPAVKSNAYGHGLLESARAFLEGGADWLCVHTIAEAKLLRDAGVTAPLYLFGPTLNEELEVALALRLDLVIYDKGQVEALRLIPYDQTSGGSPLRLHIKIETGNQRQGVEVDEALSLTDMIRETRCATLIGVTSHFANIEDTSDHSFARHQLQRPTEAHTRVEARWGAPLLCHMANSAASLLWPERALSLARVGISSYGLWPSEAVKSHAQLQLTPALRPALSWRARVAQVKDVEAGASIGYGCTYVTTRHSRIAVLPVGYFEGYDRQLSNRGAVLIRGALAPIRGRICMNICMVDVTDIME